MGTLQYKIDINASAEKVYRTMLELETYKQWTALFNPTSTYEGNWVKGSKMLFVGIGENGEKGGMVSEVVENIPNSFVSIRHNGLVKGNEEITTGEEVEKWAGGTERYLYEENDGVTTLTVELTGLDDENFVAYFNEVYPKALAKLKELAES